MKIMIHKTTALKVLSRKKNRVVNKKELNRNKKQHSNTRI